MRQIVSIIVDFLNNVRRCISNALQIHYADSLRVAVKLTVCQSGIRRDFYVFFFHFFFLDSDSAGLLLIIF